MAKWLEGPSEGDGMGRLKPCRESEEPIEEEKMESYHVYFSPRSDVSKDILIAQVHEFMATQIEGNRAKRYRILEMLNKASFQELPDYQLIVDYDSGENLREAFKGMREAYMDDPHAPLMRMVSTFRIAFSADAEAANERSVVGGEGGGVAD